MKRLILILILFVATLPVYNQGSGIGYQIDLGGSSFSQSSPEYHQHIRSITHNGFIRYHSASGNYALQLMAGHKKDKIPFQNYSDFLSPDGTEMMQYNTDAQIRREAWRMCAIHQLQAGRRPGKLMYSVNAGLFYEHTLNASRNNIRGEETYILEREIYRNNMGCIFGAELRFGWFTVGYKVEKLFRDVLNHSYIIGQELNLYNSSELRGLKLNPWMNYFTLGVNIDFFHDKKKD